MTAENRLKQKRAKRILKAALKKQAAKKIPFAGVVQDLKTRQAWTNYLEYKEVAETGVIL